MTFNTFQSRKTMYLYAMTEESEQVSWERGGAWKLIPHDLFAAS
jgi:hypothetical protein